MDHVNLDPSVLNGRCLCCGSNRKRFDALYCNDCFISKIETRSQREARDRARRAAMRSLGLRKENA